jgi:hypothetical protein
MKWKEFVSNNSWEFSVNRRCVEVKPRVKFYLAIFLIAASLRVPVVWDETPCTGENGFLRFERQWPWADGS